MAVVNSAGHVNCTGSHGEMLLVSSTLFFPLSERDCPRLSKVMNALSLLGLLYILMVRFPG